jgi:MOSC domain-containing protein YiiM
VQVSQPRWPCYKLQMHTGQPQLVKRFVDSGRCGWYLRVLEPGTAPTHGEIAIIERDPLAIPVGVAFRVRREPDADPDLFARVMSHPKLADGWRG